MTKIRAIEVLFMLLIAVLTVVSAVSAEDFVEDDLGSGNEIGIDVLWVKINEDTVESGTTIREKFTRNEEIEIKVKVQANEEPVEDLEVEASLRGVDGDEIDEASEVFDLDENTRETVELTLKLPARMDQDDYKLRVAVYDRNSLPKVYNYNLQIKAVDNAVVIKDVTFSPENGVEAGRALIGVVRVKNYGLEDEESVKIRLKIPELGLSATDYIDELLEDKSFSSEELYIRIPGCAKAGEYEAVVTVEYDDGDEETEEEYTITVLEGDVCEITPTDSQPESTTSKPVITVGSQTQDLARGEGGSIYPITITNPTSNAKTFTVGVAGTENWATTKISPSTAVIVNARETKSVYVYVSAKESATEGIHVFTLEVASDSEVKQIPLNANVVSPSGAEGWSKLKKGLLISLAVLIVLLVILGLILAFNRMKGEKEEEEDLGGQTYY